MGGGICEDECLVEEANVAVKKEDRYRNYAARERAFVSGNYEAIL